MQFIIKNFPLILVHCSALVVAAPLKVERGDIMAPPPTPIPPPDRGYHCPPPSPSNYPKASSIDQKLAARTAKRAPYTPHPPPPVSNFPSTSPSIFADALYPKKPIESAPPEDNKYGRQQAVSGRSAFSPSMPTIPHLPPTSSMPDPSVPFIPLPPVELPTTPLPPADDDSSPNQAVSRRSALSSSLPTIPHLPPTSSMPDPSVPFIPLPPVELPTTPLPPADDDSSPNQAVYHRSALRVPPPFIPHPPSAGQFPSPQPSPFIPFPDEPAPPSNKNPPVDIPEPVVAVIPTEPELASKTNAR